MSDDDEIEIEIATLKQEIHDLSWSCPLFSTDFDLSADQLTLTQAEIEARKEWNAKRDELVQHIAAVEKSPPREDTARKLSECTMLPPEFGTTYVSPRDSVQDQVAKRRYPISLHDYNEEFESIVNNYTAPDKPIKMYPRFRNGNLDDSIAHGGAQMEDEKHEHVFLRMALWGKLERFGFTIPRRKVTCQIKKLGKPDYVTFAMTEAPNDGERLKPSAVFEVKSSQSLLVPNEFADIQRKYRKGLDWITNRNEQKDEWCHVTHPLGQILGYMVDNDCRYGVLCSASKSYFLHIDAQYNCKITDARFTSDHHFFKAWAAFLNEANTNYKGSERIPNPPLTGARQWLSGWLPKTPEVATTLPPFEKLLYDFELDFVDFVDESKFELGDDLGGVRGAYTVYKTHWNGKDVAVKQFDLSKNLDCYENEIKAYKFLKGAWGKYVPTPFFVSRSKSGQVAFLGMTYGRDDDGNDEVYRKFEHQVFILKRDFNFRPLDSWYIVDENENVLVVDLEFWEPARKTNEADFSSIYKTNSNNRTNTVVFCYPR